MDTKKFGVNRRNSMVGQTYAHPPSFKDQANKHAFKISIAQKIKNFFRIKLSLQYIKEYNSSNRSISHVEQAYKIKTLTNDKSIPNNKSSTIIAKIEKKLIAMLKKKNFSNFQAKSIISKEFKNCKSPHDIEKKFLDIPNKEIYDKGYHSNKEIQQLLKNNTLSLVAKGYDKQSSKQEIEFAFNQALNKKEFKAYIDSIPGYTDYEKGYISNVELKNTKDQARKSLLQLGYSREHSEYIIRIKLDETQGKKDFLKAINNTPSKIIHNQGYKTVDEYNNLQHQYVTALKETSGYSHKQAIKFAKQEQENTNSKTHFMSLIKQIQPTQKY